MALSPRIALDPLRAASNSTLTSRDLEELRAKAEPIILVGEKLLTAQAMRLLMSIDRDLREARSQFNQDWFRRIMRIRVKAVIRLHRRWGKVDPPPLLPLGTLRRRYHANLARYLYSRSKGLLTFKYPFVFLFRRSVRCRDAKNSLR